MATVCMVVADPAALTTADTAIRDRLATTLGHTVTPVAHSAAEATGYDIGVITSSCNLSNLGTKYRTSSMPMLFLLYAAWWDYLSVTGPAKGGKNAKLLIDHPCGAGLALGTYEYISTNVNMQTSADFAASAAKVWENAANATFTCLAAFESGATVINGLVLPAPRVASGMHNEATVPLLTEAVGWAVFDASIALLVPDAVNTAPVADAGNDQTSVEGTPFTLDASASSDAEDTDGTADDGSSALLGYAWTQLSGSTAALDDPTIRYPTANTPAWTGTADDKLVWQVETTDSGGLTDTETVEVTVLKAAPAFYRYDPVRGVIPLSIHRRGP